ncbi:MAG: hypothetical protein EA424_07355, partial [Planctomycetaceae bacterium]
PPGVPWLQPVSAANVITAKPVNRLFMRNLLTLKIGTQPHPQLAKLARIPGSALLFFVIQPTSARPEDQIFRTSPRTKKADVAAYLQAFLHVGLLVNQPPSMAGLPLI